MKTLLLIDANALIHRFFHAMPPLTTPKGEPIGSVYGLCGMFFKIFTERRPDYIAAAFDRPEKTFREEQFEEYKIHRAPAPDELVSQIIRAPEVFDLFGVKKFSEAGFEADDVIGTLVERFKNEPNLKIVILTGDLDMLQLVEDDKIVVQISKTGISESVLYNEAAVEKRYGLKPLQMPDLKGFLGDASDNIPGVKGIGPKTATPLLREFKTVEGVFENLPIILPKTAKKLEGREKEALFSKKLAIIRRDVSLSVQLEELRAKEPEKPKLKKYFEEMGFRTFLERVESWKNV